MGTVGAVARQPCLGGGGEAAVGGVVPLHGRAGMITAGLQQVGDVFPDTGLPGQHLRFPGVFDLNVIEVFNFRERIVGHSEFTTLIDESWR